MRKVGFRRGVPSHPASTLDFTGTVTGKSRDGGDGLVEIEFRATHDRGDHLSGTAVIGLPPNRKHP